MVWEDQSPHPRRFYRSGVRLEYAADNFAGGEHVVVVVLPFAGGAGRRRAFEDHPAIGQRPVRASRLSSLAIGRPRPSRYISPRLRMMMTRQFRRWRLWTSFSLSSSGLVRRTAGKITTADAVGRKVVSSKGARVAHESGQRQ
jgi:hypothetical protein